MRDQTHPFYYLLLYLKKIKPAMFVFLELRIA